MDGNLRYKGDRKDTWKNRTISSWICVLREKKMTDGSKEKSK